MVTLPPYFENYVRHWYHQDLHQQLVVVQLVLGGHPASVKHYHLPAEVVVTCRHTRFLSDSNSSICIEPFVFDQD